MKDETLDEIARFLWEKMKGEIPGLEAAYLSQSPDKRLEFTQWFSDDADMWVLQMAHILRQGVQAHEEQGNA